MSDRSYRAAAWFCVWGSAGIGAIVTVFVFLVGAFVVGPAVIAGVALILGGLTAAVTAFALASYYEVRGRFAFAVAASHLVIALVLALGFYEWVSYYSLGLVQEGLLGLSGEFGGAGVV